MYFYGSPHMAAQKQDDQLERTFSSYVRIQVVVLKTYLGRWTIGRNGERGSRISVLPARYDDDDDDDDDIHNKFISIHRWIYYGFTELKRIHFVSTVTLFCSAREFQYIHIENIHIFDSGLHWALRRKYSIIIYRVHVPLKKFLLV